MADKVKVLGRNVYISLPPKEESKLELDHNTKEALNQELLRKMKKLQIWDLGPNCDKALEKGQWVLVEPSALAQAKMVPFPQKDGSEIVRALVQDFTIVHIW